MITVEIGEGILRGKGVNSLTSCFHSGFGWVWSDGRSVYLLGCSDDGSITESSTSRKLGEYSKVVSLAWSSDGGGDPSGCCFLAVHEESTVTIWEVSGRGLKPDFKLKKKIEDTGGIKEIIWHPVYPIICLLCANGVTLCSLAPDWSVQLTVQTYQTGCWTHDGRSLILAAGSSLKVFQWGDILGSKNSWNQRNITLSRSHGRVRCILGLPSRKIVATTDLPLAEIINQSNHDAFEPLIVNRDTGKGRTLITEVSDSLSGIESSSKVSQSEAALGEVKLPSTTGSSNLLDRLKDEIASREKGPIDLTSMMGVYAGTDHRGPKMVTEEPRIGQGCSGSSEKNVINGAAGRTEHSITEGGRQPVAGVSDLFLDEDFIKREDLGVSRPIGWNLPSSDSHSSRSTAIPVFKQSEQEKTNTLFVGSRSNRHIQLYRAQNDTIERINEQLLSLKDQERPVGISCSGLVCNAVTILVSEPVTSSMQGVFPSAPGSQRVKLSFRQITK